MMKQVYRGRLGVHGRAAGSARAPYPRSDTPTPSTETRNLKPETSNAPGIFCPLTNAVEAGVS